MNFDEMLKTMRIKYLKDVESKTNELETMVRNKDLKALESFFHKLKGSGASYGLPKFSDYGAKFEVKAKNNELSNNDLKNCLSEFKELLDLSQEKAA